MAVFKCKMCGGSLDINSNETVVTCEYCGTQQTLPKFDDERKITLFTRANHLRFNCEFDKATGVYESIVSEFPDEDEAYWGLVLCKYGIEYVDDKDGKKIPTCHRTIPTSIMDDEDFSLACDYADTTSKSIYRDEAKVIDGIQKKILKIAATEKPYDIFICYKETDDNTGSRTEDSTIAQDIYTELIKEGYKVFFSRVTLREVAGTEYEPYIYAALSSAKIMLAIGTKYEYYDAVWVKNEWSRYISMIGDDSSKILIPCYRSMDAYDMPKEFKNMQALDMGDVTFFASLTANINSLLPQENVVVNTGTGTDIAPLLKRAFMFLEDGNWNSADEYCEKVLDLDPECADAYLGKFMVDMKVKKQADIANLTTVFTENTNYQKAFRFADSSLKETLKRYFDCATKNSKYESAINLMKYSSVESSEKAIEIFKTIIDWKDSKEKVIICEKTIESFRRIEIYDKRTKRNKQIIICSLMGVCLFLVVLFRLIVPGIKYNKATSLLENGKHEEAFSIFSEIGGFHDSVDQCLQIQLSTAEIGSVIYFGSYNHEKIEWIVLEKSNNEALLISKNLLAQEEYTNSLVSNISWKDCSLRVWLNKDFMKKAFSSKESQKIVPTTNGKNVVDYVFLLNEAEAKKYFSSDEERIAEYSPYVYTDKSDTSWWLRDTGKADTVSINLEFLSGSHTFYKITGINETGAVDELHYGGDGYCFDSGVRPVVRIEY